MTSLLPGLKIRVKGNQSELACVNCLLPAPLLLIQEIDVKVKCGYAELIDG